MIKIGYQGTEGSNSEAAAESMASQMKLSDYQLVPLISSFNVIGKLKRKDVDYGVVAIKNNVGGIVQETLKVLRDEDLELVNADILYINHALFKKSAEVDNTKITRIISHIQALKQCAKHLEELFPQAKLEAIEDTAIGARYLADGKYGDDTAVLCKQTAGESYGLYLEHESMQDDPENRTEFKMFQNPTYPTDNEHKSSLFDRLGLYAINDQGGLGYLTQGLMIAAIFLAFMGQDYFGWSQMESATTVAGSLSAIFIFLTSSKLKNYFQYRSIQGYWKYFAVPEKQDSKGPDQKYETPRVVHIKELDGSIVLRGWLCDKENIPLFKSDSALLSALGQRIGSLVYWYSDPTQKSRGFGLNGIVTLNWELDDPASQINIMSGWYMGRSTEETGSIRYVRITKHEYDVLKKSDYL